MSANFFYISRDKYIYIIFFNISSYSLAQGMKEGAAVKGFK